MADSIACEKVVVEKLIFVLSKAINCQKNNDNEIIGIRGEPDNSELSVVEKVLQVLLSHNGTFLYSGSSNNEAMDDQSLIVDNENSTDALRYSEETRTYSGGDSTASGTEYNIGTHATNKLHKLELIKVFVLIFVISIILLTTCRMVFQLFLRFRPEKPPLG